MTSDLKKCLSLLRGELDKVSVDIKKLNFGLCFDRVSFINETILHLINETTDYKTLHDLVCDNIKTVSRFKCNGDETVDCHAKNGGECMSPLSKCRFKAEIM